MTPDPASPCIRICRIDAGLCRGCGRTLHEISLWPSADAALKRAILAAVEARMASAGAARDA